MAKAKILLVDDTRLVLELEKSFLKISEVDVFTASNGVEALEVIRNEAPDLVFMDMHMPEMDGLECCAAIKADPFICDTPVIILTTAGHDEDREKAVRAGCNDFLTKPVQRREFLEMARRYTSSVDRRGLRLPCHFPVLVLLGNSSLSANALDISDGGIFVASHQKVVRDTPVKVAFYLEGENPLLLEVKGRVAWLNEENGRIKSTLPAGFGIEFVDLGEEEAPRLKSYLQADGAIIDGTA
ncbi:two-component system response regulator [Geomonas sp. Red276]